MPTDPATATAPTRIIHAEPLIVMTAARMAQRLTFNRYCHEYSIGEAREALWWYAVNHGYTPGEELAAWQWEAYRQAFDARDQRDTQHDALR